MTTNATPSDGATRWFYPLLLALVFAVLVWGSWRRWGNPFVDFGIELYVAWQLSEGKHLYRDIVWLGGPLSQYTNALWFRLFGVSYLTLSLVNIAFVAGLTVLLYRFFTRTIERAAGFTAGLVLLVVFAFQAYETDGSWDYVAPYRHEAVHGLGLAILGLAIFATYLRQGGKWRSFGVGLCFGAVCLTKIEPSVALAGALAGGYWLGFNYLPPRRERWRQDIGWFVGGVAVVPVGFGLYLATQMPLGVALTGLLGNWLNVARTDAVGQVFYQRVMGLGRWRENLLRMGGGCGAFIGVLGVFTGLEVALRRVTRGWVVWSGAAFLVTWLIAHTCMPWAFFLRPLPLLTGLILAGVAWTTMHCSDQTQLAQRWIPLTVWCVFGLLLLGKLGLAAHAGQYGFTLALPATVLLAVSAISLWPEFIRAKAWGTGALVRWGSAGVLVAFFLAAQESRSYFHSAKTIPLGAGADRMQTFGPPLSETGGITAAALEHMAQTMPPGATLVVIPDGIILNYLLRHENPTPYTVFDPVLMAVYGGEERVVETLTAHPPDYIAWVQRSFQEYGLAPFGQDPRFGRTILVWVEKHYEVVQVYGAPPIGEAFGIALLRRKATSGEAASHAP
ncbi:glycosyltransferase family 39 protein [Chloracidobacterium aggregatum]|uniref:ArnT family glycosyltransferase n=1 Tax=Chloracidobacterium aggregatum TaxID=2851959 RepID=UPI001B8BA3D1|nr:glycosyltransferase family 39 protein [Chloracidobacterium aggregatum]QUV84389.1 glycosyltransferase family 39 protein [Chloracidobacterium sp. 2]QUV87128.1 glycosyltransferase family 39 protein [Chloracidobacterium sp. S]QUV90029.1 glycosyltransferase family 39 protein [Chloracidobacterium sp. A]